jgi:Mg-chelatase subunit ChlD
MSDTAVHIYFVLDRSGSMEVIRDDVVGGFNSFVAQQRAERGDCLMTLIQFDSNEPFEVLVDAQPLDRLKALSSADFQPRGGTPLFDAMGHAITNATIRAEQRAAAGEDPEHVLFVTFTDGMENASAEYDREKIFAAIKRREERGWTFVYMGANQDAYAEGGAMGYAVGSTQNFLADAHGTRMAFGSLSRSASLLRGRLAIQKQVRSAEFFDGQKEAEADLQRRGSS